MSLIDSFTDLVYPRRCAVCDRVMPQGSGLVCHFHDKLPYVTPPCCLKCGKEVEDENQEYCSDCARHVRTFVRAYPVFNYIEPVKTSVQAVKYHNKREYCDFYAEAMAEKLRPELSYMKLDAIVPVPIHIKKRKSRGYNQAEVLAKKLGHILDIQVHSDMLQRISDTRPQKELDDIDRANNIKQAMAIGRTYPECKNVLLVDDIYTTGVTAQVCTELLYKAGVEKVYVAIICIGKGR